MSKQNMPFRQAYVAVAVQVPTTATKLTTLIETILGIAVGSLAGAWREVIIQVDPETSAASTIRIGNGNVGTTVGGVVQKGISMFGGSNTDSATFSNEDITTRWVQAVAAATSGAENVINCQLFAL